MKYISLDLETTCLTPCMGHILELAAVIEDSENPLPLDQLPRFHVLVKHEEIRGQAYALQLNRAILEELAGVRPARTRIVNVEELERDFIEWVGYNFGNDKATLAGKNVAVFDYQFLSPDMQSLFRHRMIDPGSIFINWNEKTLPGSDQLLVKNRIRDRAAHDALTDALDMVSLLRTTYATHRS